MLQQSTRTTRAYRELSELRILRILILRILFIEPPQEAPARTWREQVHFLRLNINRLLLLQSARTA